MIIFEDTDKALTKHIPWHLPDGVRSHLESVKDSNKNNSLTKNHSTKEAWDHLNDIIDMDDNLGIDIKEMKRIKNWFENHTNASKTKQYELYGGEIMMNWVNNQLESARRTIRQQKEAERAMGKDNAFKKEHTADRQTKVTKVDDKTPTYNPATQNKQNNLKELISLKENRNIIITEKQKLLTEAVNPSLFKSNFFDNISTAFWQYNFPRYKDYIDKNVTPVLGSPIGAGSSRIVYQFDDNIILKIAINDKGIKQTEIECNAYEKTTKYKELFTHVYSHTKDYVCAIMEYCIALTDVNADEIVQEIFGVQNFQQFSTVLERITDYKSNGETKEEVVNHIIRDLNANNCLNLSLLIEYIYDNPILAEEVIFDENLGITRRNTGTWLVIIDNGFNNNVAREYFGYDFIEGGDLKV